MLPILDRFLKSKNIAVVRTDKIGDMVLTLPLIRAIKEFMPDSNVFVIAKKYVEPLLKNQEILKPIFIDNFKNGIDEIFKSYKFDTVFYPMPVFSECLAGFKNKIPIRIGSAYRLYSFLFNAKVKDHRKISEYHEAEYNVRMLNSITGINHKVELEKPYINPEDIDFISTKYLKLYAGKKIIIVHPGSGGSSKDLPVEKMNELIDKLNNNNNEFQIILTGIQSENEQCEYILSKNKNIKNLCGKINLEQMIALISLCNLFIANSTGVLHIAAALDKQVLGFYPNTPHIGPKRWRPYTNKSIISTPPKSDNTMFNDDMSTIDMNEVYVEIMKSMKNL
jgi:ADP-heptose:LPS heptosyltransferase